VTYVVCRDCRRPLRSEESRRTGYGPVCGRKHKPPNPRAHRTPKRRISARPAPVPAAPDELPGQETLPMFHFEATLWSL
jgi:hypothetical protein